MPSWPQPPSPHEYSAPSAVTAAVKEWPADTVVILVLRNTGTNRGANSARVSLDMAAALGLVGPWPA